MLAAIVSDIHSNAEALAAVLEDVKAQKADEIWCLGDIVGYGADPDAVTEKMREAAVVSVAGNHDWAACGLISTRFFNRHAAAAAEWTAHHASRATLDWLAALPLVSRREGIVLVHATPSAPAAEQIVRSSWLAPIRVQSRVFATILCTAPSVPE